MLDYINKIIEGDCLEVMKQLPENIVDSVVTDPPYGIGIVKWDYFGSRNKAREQLYEFTKSWGSECIRLMKPGAFLISFSSTKTSHIMSYGLEDAGFILRNTIAWVYATGYIKGYNLGRKAKQLNYEVKQEYYKYNTEIKPAFEPILVFQKPLSEKTYLDNYIKWGVGVFNLEDTKHDTGVMTGEHKTKTTPASRIFERFKNSPIPPSTFRYPCNFIHDGSEEVLNQFAITGYKDKAVLFYVPKPTPVERDYGLTPNPTLFDQQTQLTPKKKEHEFCLQYYEGKSRKETSIPKFNNHPTVKPIDLIRYLIRLVTPKNGIVLDPFAGSGTTGIAAISENNRYILIEKEPEYANIAKERLINITTNK